MCIAFNTTVWSVGAADAVAANDLLDLFTLTEMDEWWKTSPIGAQSAT